MPSAAAARLCPGLADGGAAGYAGDMGRSGVFLRVVLSLTLALLLASGPAGAFDLFATRHEVTAQFATADGKPMANAEVRVFAPGEPNRVVETGRTNADGKFAFSADRDGMWSAEARNADEVARVMVRVGGPTQEQSRVSPFAILGGLALLLALAVWYRLLRARNGRSGR
jgi:hypothetical protein